MLRRVARISYYAIFGVSLLLLGTTLLLWLRSHLRGDIAVHYNEPELFELHSVDGLMRITCGDLASRNYPPPPGWHGTFWGDTDYFAADLASGTYFGFGFEHYQRSTPDLKADARSLTLPYWLLAFLSLVWPVTSLLLARRRRKGRGFAVAAKAAGSTPLPPGEVAAQRSGADARGRTSARDRLIIHIPTAACPLRLAALGTSPGGGGGDAARRLASVWR